MFQVEAVAILLYGVMPVLEILPAVHKHSINQALIQQL
jgi:hypothetical protein